MARIPVGPSQPASPPALTLIAFAASRSCSLTGRRCASLWASWLEVTPRSVFLDQAAALTANGSPAGAGQSRRPRSPPRSFRLARPRPRVIEFRIEQRDFQVRRNGRERNGHAAPYRISRLISARGLQVVGPTSAARNSVSLHYDAFEVVRQRRRVFVGLSYHRDSGQRPCAGWRAPTVSRGACPDRVVTAPPPALLCRPEAESRGAPWTSTCS